VSGEHVELSTGQTLAVDRYGDPASRPIVLLHGLSSSRLGYGSVVPHVADRRGACVLNVDQRCHGESTRATLDTYDAPSYAADVAALIETLGDQPAVIVGHSLGGVVAAALAVARPELVRGLFLEDPPTFEADAERRAASPAARWFPALIAAVRELQARDAPVEEYERFSEPGAPRDEVVARCRSLRLWDPVTMEAAVNGVFWNAFDPLAPLACPVTLLRADPQVGAVFQPGDADQLAAANPHAQIIEVPGAGHTIHSAATLGAYVAHLEAFLETV
jgi:pimeloyl-ACP methyl ester carboxylesterase